MQILTYGQSGLITVLFSGELNSLGNNGVRTATADFSNLSGYQSAEVEYRGASVQSYNAGTGVSIWLLRGVVSGIYEDGSSGFVPARSPDVFLNLVSGSIRTTKRCLIPPGWSRPLLMNNGTGVTLASSGNLVRLMPLTNVTVSG